MRIDIISRKVGAALLVAGALATGFFPRLATAGARSHPSCPPVYCSGLPEAKQDAWSAGLPPATLTPEQRAAHDAQRAELDRQVAQEQQRARTRVTWPVGLVPGTGAGVVSSSLFMSSDREHVWLAHVGKSWIAASPGNGGNLSYDTGAVLVMAYDEYGDVIDVKRVLADAHSGVLTWAPGSSGTSVFFRGSTGARFRVDLAAWPSVTVEAV